MYRQDKLEEAIEKMLYDPTVGDIIQLKARVEEMMEYTKVVTKMSQDLQKENMKLRAVLEYHEQCHVCGRDYSEHEAGEVGVCEFIQADAVRQAGNVVEDDSDE